MRAFGCAVPLVAAACVTAHADCLKANADGQSASGKLQSIMFSTPAYNLKEQAYILQLDTPACLDGPDKVDKSMRIHVYSMDKAMLKKLRSLVGKTVRVTGQPYGEENAHHHAPIVMGIDAVESVPAK